MSASCISEADSKFLLAVIATSKLSINYEAVAEYMGEDVTANALRMRFSRLKTKLQACTNLSQGTSNTPKSTPQSTPKRTPKSTPGKRKRAKLLQDPKTEVEVEIKVEKEEIQSIKKEEPAEDTKLYDDHLSDC